jgi:hypothetical protein
VEADVEQAAHIGTAYSQRPKLVEALHVPLCPWEPKWPFARFVSAIHEIRCPILSGLSMLMLKSISFPAMCWGATPCDRDGALN